MVHNGIEYAMMQLTSEVYDLLHRAAGLSNDELHQVFDTWNKGRLQSFLVEITAEIFLQEDDLGSGRLVDMILDKAKQKGTGKWTSQNAMDLGIPVPTIDMAVSMREVSALKSLRVDADSLYDRPKLPALPKEELIEQAEQALYFSFVISYAQGLHQLAEASKEYGYELDLSQIAKIWRAGCIIRAGMLADIAEAFGQNPKLENLLLSPSFVDKVNGALPAIRSLARQALERGIAMPGLLTSISYFDALTTGRLPLNLIQAQRDHFGSHTYERIDRDGIFHTEWGE